MRGVLSWRFGGVGSLRDTWRNEHSGTTAAQEHGTQGWLCHSWATLRTLAEFGPGQCREVGGSTGIVTAKCGPKSPTLGPVLTKHHRTAPVCDPARPSWRGLDQHRPNKSAGSVRPLASSVSLSRALYVRRPRRLLTLRGRHLTLQDVNDSGERPAVSGQWHVASDRPAAGSRGRPRVGAQWWAIRSGQ